MSLYGRLTVTESNSVGLESGKTYDVTVDDSGHLEVIADSTSTVGTPSDGTPSTTDEVAAPASEATTSSVDLDPSSTTPATP